MSQPTTEEKDPIVIKNVADVDERLARLDVLATNIAGAKSVFDDDVKAANQVYGETVSPWLEEQQEILRALKDHLLPRRRSWLRRFGRTAKLENGVVKWNKIGASLLTTKDEAPVIAALLGMRGGKKFLRIKWELERKAFSSASPGLLARLRPLGVFYTQQETLTVQPGKHKPIELDKRPFPRLK